jgi:hypothetical protein
MADLIADGGLIRERTYAGAPTVRPLWHPWVLLLR